jgi:hypothetical protein
MPPKKNPLKLNPLQLKTLTLLQELARSPETSQPLPDSEDVFISALPRPHGDHFHVGRRVVLSRDATGLTNAAVWTALERKGLIKGVFPAAVTLTRAGLDYDTGMRDEILHGSDH